MRNNHIIHKLMSFGKGNLQENAKKIFFTGYRGGKYLHRRFGY